MPISCLGGQGDTLVVCRYFLYKYHISIVSMVL